MRTPLVFCAIAAAVVTPIACGGSKSSPAEAQPTAGTPAVATPPEMPWEDLEVEQKKEHMKTVVVPVMKPAFQAVDSTEFAEFGCTTCHGEAAKEGKFEMPNENLPQLSADLAKEKEEHPEMVKFMGETVVPTMAKALGKDPYTPSNPTGFGCAACHTFKK